MDLELIAFAESLAVRPEPSTLGFIDKCALFGGRASGTGNASECLGTTAESVDANSSKEGTLVLCEDPAIEQNGRSSDERCSASGGGRPLVSTELLEQPRSRVDQVRALLAGRSSDERCSQSVTAELVDANSSKEGISVLCDDPAMEQKGRSLDQRCIASGGGRPLVSTELLEQPRSRVDQVGALLAGRSSDERCIASGKGRALVSTELLEQPRSRVGQVGAPLAGRSSDERCKRSGRGIPSVSTELPEQPRSRVDQMGGPSAGRSSDERCGASGGGRPLVSTELLEQPRSRVDQVGAPLAGRSSDEQCISGVHGEREWPQLSSPCKNEGSGMCQTADGGEVYDLAVAVADRNGRPGLAAHGLCVGCKEEQAEPETVPEPVHSPTSFVPEFVMVKLGIAGAGTLEVLSGTQIGAWIPEACLQSYEQQAMRAAELDSRGGSSETCELRAMLGQLSRKHEQVKGKLAASWKENKELKDQGKALASATCWAKKLEQRAIAAEKVIAAKEELTEVLHCRIQQLEEVNSCLQQRQLALECLDSDRKEIQALRTKEGKARRIAERLEAEGASHG